MSRILAAHQPNFFPWLGWWEKWFIADVFILMDDVMYKRRDYINRVQLIACGVEWLTVPIEREEYGKTPISEIKPMKGWGQDVYNTLCGWYGPQLDLVNPLLGYGYDSLLAINQMTYDFALAKIFDPGQSQSMLNKVRLASELDTPATKTERIIEYCKWADCDVYLSGMGAKEYLDEGLMNRCGIKVLWQGQAVPYPYPVYTGMSVLNYKIGGCNLYNFDDFCSSRRELLCQQLK